MQDGGVCASACRGAANNQRRRERVDLNNIAQWANNTAMLPGRPMIHRFLPLGRARISRLAAGTTTTGEPD
jgi:hypothetical protein